MNTAPPRRPSRRSLLIGALVAGAAGTAGCSDGRAPAGERTGGRLSGGELLELHVDGETLRPVVELAMPVEVTWFDLDEGSVLGTGTTPVLAIRAVERVGMQVSLGGRSALDQVRTLNLGFNRADDYGRLSLDAFHEHEPQPVTGITGLSLLTHLARLCASRTPLSGRLDLTGLSYLEHVECYQCDIDSLDLTGCTSLVRLCVEDCRLRELDLEPVRHSLQDLRAAIQRSDELTFARLSGPMEALYHYCVRGQQVNQVIPHAQLPVVEEYWATAAGQRACDAPVSPLLRSYLARDNELDQASVDAVLSGLATRVTGGPGRVDLSGRSPADVAAAAPSEEGQAAVRALEARGWRVSTN